MDLKRRWRWGVVLCCGVLICGQLCGWVGWLPSVGLPEAVVGEGGRLPDGMYAVLAESDTFEAADDVSEAHKVLEHDGRHIGEMRPVRYVAVGLRYYVPFQFSGLPDMTQRDDELVTLSLALEDKYVGGLEGFTTEYSRVAVVIDGEIVTVHKVREPIRDGCVQISQCRDDACRVLYGKLVD